MEKIYELLNELHPEYDYHNSSDFVQDGLLDSFDVVSLVSALEENYEILIDALEVLPENFATVQSIADLIRKSGGIL